jgi:RNA recognition motif-containing protein
MPGSLWVQSVFFVQTGCDNNCLRSTNSMTKTLYLGNLAWAVTNEDLANVVGQYCEVISARVATDRETGRSRGFGFVEVPADKAQEVIDALNGAEWAGRPLTVNEARPREERPRNSGRR